MYISNASRPGRPSKQLALQSQHTFLPVQQSILQLLRVLSPHWEHTLGVRSTTLDTEGGLYTQERQQEGNNFLSQLSTLAIWQYSTVQCHVRAVLLRCPSPTPFL